MSERAAFINAILDNPDDDTARLVFADWLEEHGEPERAEFIRCQIAAARLPEAGLPPSAPAKRADVLLATHGAEWRGSAGLGGHEGRYERGFLTAIHFSSTTFHARARQLLAREPGAVVLYLDALHEDDEPVTTEEVDALAADPLLRAVVRVEDQASAFGPERFAQLMRAPYLRNLRAVDVSRDRIGATGVRAILAARAAFDLASLDLYEALQPHGQGGESPDVLEAVALIAASPRLAWLSHLGLPHNGLGDRCIELLLASVTLPRALHLDLEYNAYDEERFHDALAERFDFESDES